MRSILAGLFGTPERNKENEKDENEESKQDDQIEPISIDQQMMAPRIPPPRRSSSLNRVRSLSRVFNVLPQALPRCQDLWIDAVEFYLHALLLETNPGRQKELRTDLEKVLTFSRVNAERGRIFTRFQVTSLASTITVWGDYGDPLHVPSSSWQQWIDELLALRCFMLRPDANKLIYGEAHDLPPTPHTQPELVEHDMFQADFHAVETTFKRQHAFAVFREELNITLQQKPSRHKTLWKHTVDKLRKADAIVPPLLELCGKKDVSPDDIRSALSLCEEFLGFEESYEYSYAHAQHSLRSLLIKWSESVLEAPVLFQLGYGGVTAPVEDTDVNDDVSSFGGDDQQDEEDSVVVEERQARFVAQKRVLLNKNKTRKTTSFADQRKDVQNDKQSDPPQVATAEHVERSGSPEKKSDQVADAAPEQQENGSRSAMESPREPKRKKHRFVIEGSVAFKTIELDAIKKGVKLHGIGNWTAIQESSKYLSDRSTEEIRDKVHMMYKNGDF